jgi:hypothetical protein
MTPRMEDGKMLAQKLVSRVMTAAGMGEIIERTVEREGRDEKLTNERTNEQWVTTRQECWYIRMPKMMRFLILKWLTDLWRKKKEEE